MSAVEQMEVQGKYQPYPDYKDSGVEWLGEVPSHWIVTAVKRFSRFTTGWTPPTGNDAYFGGDHLWANISDIGPKVLYGTAKTITDAGVRATRIRKSPKGSLLFSFKLSIGLVSIVGSEMYTNEAIATFLSSDKLNVSYMYWAAPLFIPKNAEENIYGAKLLNQERIGNADFVLPSQTEQRTIAAFLDYETARIDKLIAQQQRLIELLKEKRQAMISHCVSLKAGESKVKLSYAINLTTGFPFPSTGFRHESTDNIPLLRGVNVGVEQIKWDETVYWDSEDCEHLKEYFLKPGDIVFGMDRPWISSGARVSEIAPSDTPSLLLQRVARIRTTEDFYQPFIRLCLSSMEFRAYVEADLTGVSVPHISPEQIKNFYIRNIPFEEQKLLTEKVLLKINKLNVIEKSSLNAIEIMLERRTALISAAVTGKIDLRGWFQSTQEVVA